MNLSKPVTASQLLLVTIIYIWDLEMLTSENIYTLELMKCCIWSSELLLAIFLVSRKS